MINLIAFGLMVAALSGVVFWLIHNTNQYNRKQRMLRASKGQFKSFGPFGPKYEVGAKIRQLKDNDWLVEITMIESGEKSEYRLSKISSDPEAQ